MHNAATRRVSRLTFRTRCSPGGRINIRAANSSILPHTADPLLLRETRRLWLTQRGAKRSLLLFSLFHVLPFVPFA